MHEERISLRRRSPARICWLCPGLHRKHNLDDNEHNLDDDEYNLDDAYVPTEWQLWLHRRQSVLQQYLHLPRAPMP